MDYDDDSGIEEQTFKVTEEDDDLLDIPLEPLDVVGEFEEPEEDPEDKYH